LRTFLAHIFATFLDPAQHLFMSHAKVTLILVWDQNPVNFWRPNLIMGGSLVLLAVNGQSSKVRKCPRTRILANVEMPFRFDRLDFKAGLVLPTGDKSYPEGGKECNSCSLFQVNWLKSQSLPQVNSFGLENP
jgi:hypothetical protein